MASGPARVHSPRMDPDRREFVADADASWITDVWDSGASHQASLALPSVRQAIAKRRPLIAGFGPSTGTAPVGGPGLPTAVDATTR